MPKPPKPPAKSYSDQIADALRPGSSFPIPGHGASAPGAHKAGKPGPKSAGPSRPQSKPPTSAPRRTSG